MRYQSFVQSVVVKTVAANFAKIDAFAGQVHGGWEGWLQLEIYYYAVTNKLNLGLFEREKPYPAKQGIADFAFNPANASDMTLWSELKVQTAVTNVFQSYEGDIHKIVQIKFPKPEANTVGAMAVFSGANQDLATTRKWAAGNKSSGYVIDTKGNSVDLSSTSIHTLNNTIVVVYFISL
jgi:hypothetical protein